MPHVINGIGTWYYGKKRIHRLKGTCEFCNCVGELTSYDTTLYAVVFMIPVAPLGQKRILSQCPSCQKHRAVALKEWEAAKAKSIADLLAQLEQDPDNRDAILSGLNLAMWYQDEELFNKLAATLADHRRDDSAIQSQLAAGYSYFARYAEAEAAYRAALAVEDTPVLQRQLAWVLLKQGRPDDAFPYLAPILENKEPDGAGMIFLLAEALQAQGQHRQALELMNVRDEAFPDLAETKEYKKQRRVSERYQNSGKKVASAYLAESKKVGYREGNWTASLPRLIPFALAIGLLSWYLGAAVWIGHNRQVHLVNGWDKPYTVAVNGKEHRLAPGSARPVRIPEGDVAIEFRDPALKLEPVRCRLESNFFARPFLGRTVVINPDRLAVVVREKAEYSKVPQPGPGHQPEYHSGAVLHEFSGIDYEFAPFPHSLTVKGSGTITKTRVGLEVSTTPEGRLHLVAPEQQQDYVRQWLRLDPDNAYLLAWLVKQLPPAEALALVEPNLAVRPLLVENHRFHQYLMEKHHPERDLRPDYQKLVAETKRQPDALYLLARLIDGDESDRLLKEAAGATPPSGRALQSLGFRALSSGRFPDAVRWLEQAQQLAPNDPFVKRDFWSARLAAGRHDQLLQEITSRPVRAEERLSQLIDQLQLLAIKGDTAKARAAIDTALQLFQGPEAVALRPIVKASLEKIQCCAVRDVAGWLACDAQLSSGSAFETAFLRGQLHEAANLVDRQNDERATVQHALLYLAAQKAADRKLGDEQWQLLLAVLARGTRHERQLGDMLAGRQPMTVEALRRLPIEARQKRVLLLVAARRQPDLEKDLLPLARQLDFQPDDTSLCLALTLGEVKPPNKK